jgi:nitrogen-specific signal transduction histidine kinase
VVVDGKPDAIRTRLDTDRENDTPPAGDDPSDALKASSMGMLRHDFKNHLTAMRSGCVLLERYLEVEDLDRVRSYLAQMQSELQRGFALVDRLPAGE